MRPFASLTWCSLPRRRPPPEGFEEAWQQPDYAVYLPPHLGQQTHPPPPEATSAAVPVRRRVLKSAANQPLSLEELWRRELLSANVRGSLDAAPHEWPALPETSPPLPLSAAARRRASLLCRCAATRT